MKNNKLIIWLQSFNSVTAIAGGLALIGGSVTPPLSYLKYTDFDSFYFPGVILLCIVGGSALFATIALYKKLPVANIVSVLAAIIMLIWIVCEVVSIREFNALQLVYLVTSLIIIYKTPSES